MKPIVQWNRHVHTIYKYYVSAPGGNKVVFNIILKRITNEFIVCIDLE